MPFARTRRRSHRQKQQGKEEGQRCKRPLHAAFSIGRGTEDMAAVAAPSFNSAQKALLRVRMLHHEYPGFIVVISLSMFSHFFVNLGERETDARNKLVVIRRVILTRLF